MGFKNAFACFFPAPCGRIFLNEFSASDSSVSCNSVSFWDQNLILSPPLVINAIFSKTKGTLWQKNSSEHFQGSASVLAKCQIYEHWISENANASAAAFNSKRAFFLADIGK